MRRLNAVAVSGGMVATLLSLGCGQDEPLAGPNLAIQAAKPAAGLKVTPPQLSFTAVGESATLTASSSAGSISVAVSTPACASVVLKTVQPKQSKFTVTATAAGTCTLTVIDGGTGNVQVPVTVAGSPTLVGTSLAAGIFHTCGLDVNGAAWCWGFNGAGQLGNAANVGAIAANPTPLAVAGGMTFASLTAGSNHTCGLTSAGAAYCWGSNASGQLGNPTNSGSPQVGSLTPLPVDGNLTFTAIEAGNDFSCGLTSQGVLYCWGSNLLGQLGTTTNNNSSVPNPTPTPVAGLTFTAFNAGATHTCGVAAGGVVYCWGNNFDAQLGNVDDIGFNVPHPTPTVVQGVPAVVALVATNHTCGLTSTGAAWCWGSNHVGQLGVPTPTADHPTPVAAGEGLSFVSLGLGGGHTCGLTSAGTAYCWGGNVNGVLGTSTNFGTNTPNYSPIAVSGVSLVALGINAAHSCGLTAAGEAWCWGANTWGQLGTTTNNGTSTGVPTPAVVSGGIVFATP